MRGKNLKIMMNASVLLISLVICMPCKGKVIYVDVGALGVNDGTSWADAYNYLQDALTEASTAEKPLEILVAKGIYKADQGAVVIQGDRGELFKLINGVSILGGYAGFGEVDPDARDIDQYKTVLSGDLNDDDIEVVDSDDLMDEPGRIENSYQIVTGSGTDKTAVLDGFTITGGNADVFTNRNGGGLLNEYGSPQIINCTFSRNSAQYYGGGIYNYYGNPTFINCTLKQNSSVAGGGIYNYNGNPTFIDCTFTQNSSGGINNSGGGLTITNCMFIDNRSSTGGGIYSRGGAAIITNCTFTGNWAKSWGGGIYCFGGDSSITNCMFSENSTDYGGGGMYFNNGNLIMADCIFAENAAYYGGGMYNSGSPVMTKCTFSRNSGRDYGGGMYNEESPAISYCAFYGNSANSNGGAMYDTGHSPIYDNCIFSGNSARRYGGAISFSGTHSILNNCTFSMNSAPDGSALAFRANRSSTVELNSCILWSGGDEVWNNDNSKINISYSNFDGSWPGTGNIDADPLFTDPDGPDDVPGTEDDDLRLVPLSPCIDAGDPNYMSELNETDFGGNPRIVGGRVDIGAYEHQGIIYVDNQVFDNPQQSDPYQDGSDAHPFDLIQEGISVAKDGQTVLVRPGVYPKIDFMGKAITVAGTDGAAVIEANTQGIGASLKEDAVTFHTGEGPDSVLKNFIVRNSSMAISLNYGSSPTITNLTIVDNDFGISAYENSNPDISNCIFWNNRDGDLFQCQARYSCFENEVPGLGNISANPLFVDADNGDYHLSSEGWRWNGSGTWTYDNITSLCIDTGDPASPLGDELLSAPRDPNNEYGMNLRINMGAYGGTYQASIPPLNWWPEPDFEPPVPNPAQWAYNGEPRESYGGDGPFDYWVQMSAVRAMDASGPVQYFFECTTEPVLSSGWQSSRTYSLLVGMSGQGHHFRVKTRDSLGNETEWSAGLSAN